jgi:hypothetical protein
MPLKVGDVIPAEVCQKYKKSGDLISFLKEQTYSLNS